MRSRRCPKDEHDRKLNGLKFVTVLNRVPMCAKQAELQPGSDWFLPPSGGSGGVTDSNQYPVVKVTAVSVLDGRLGENMFVLLNVTVSCQINSHGGRSKLALMGPRQFHWEFIINMQPRGTLNLITEVYLQMIAEPMPWTAELFAFSAMAMRCSSSKAALGTLTHDGVWYGFPDTQGNAFSRNDAQAGTKMGVHWNEPSTRCGGDAGQAPYMCSLSPPFALHF